MLMMLMFYQHLLILKIRTKNRLSVEKRFRFIESKQPIRLKDGTEAYENRTNSSWRNYILDTPFKKVILNLFQDLN
jgi:hypothetical protein